MCNFHFLFSQLSRMLNATPQLQFSCINCFSPTAPSQTMYTGFIALCNLKHELKQYKHTGGAGGRVIQNCVNLKLKFFGVRHSEIN
jgi:hypothetical protein